MKEKGKDVRGITLISLVITIIVLLILAGVTITMLTGEHGIMTRAKTAREKHEIGQAQEQTRLGEMEGVMNQYLVPAMSFATGGDKNNDGQVDEWEEVAFGDEKFTVIKKDGKTLTLLAKYNLETIKDVTTGKWKQLSAAGGRCAFSNSNYWNTQGHWTEGTRTDLNNETMPETETEDNNAIKRARAYAAQFGATGGRLLSYEEAISSETTTSTYLFNNHVDDVLKNCNFWLGSSHENGSNYVYGVYDGNEGYNSYHVTSSCGVRPVLKVSDSLSQ